MHNTSEYRCAQEILAGICRVPSAYLSLFYMLLTLLTRICSA
jgi:hypothetical protein